MDTRLEQPENTSVSMNVMHPLMITVFSDIQTEKQSDRSSVTSFGMTIVVKPRQFANADE